MSDHRGVFSALWTIVREEGILGLFSGLLPRLLSDILVYTFATTGVYVIHQYIVHDRDIKKYIDTLVHVSKTVYSLLFNVQFLLL